MKFKFEYPMKKGQCFTCPMCYRDDEHFYDICQLNGGDDMYGSES